MIPAYTSGDFYGADIKAIEDYGIPGIVLMENAGRSAAEEIVKRSCDKVFLVLCGPGNNGGDGFVVARYLALKDYPVSVLLSSAPENYRGDAATHLLTVVRMRLPVKLSSSLDERQLSEVIGNSPVVIDALLGTGFKGSLRGEVLRLVQATQSKESGTIFALDIPTGINADTGEVEGAAIKADTTITFSAVKLGLFITPGADFAGEVVTGHIGIKPEMILPHQPSAQIWKRQDTLNLLPHWGASIHKRTKGSLLIIGGSAHYRGAPLLAALGAFKAGCGLVTLAVPDFMASSVSAYLPEAILEPLPSDGGNLNLECLKTLREKRQSFSAVILGPGLIRQSEYDNAFRAFLNEWTQPLLLDAGAFDYLSAIEKEMHPHLVITPHAGEAARLLNKTSEAVMTSRLKSADVLSEKYGTVVLKGRNSLIASRQRLDVVAEGSSLLATAGSGDVLSGAVGALLAAGMSNHSAALAGTLLHASAGSTLAETVYQGILARDIAEEMSKIIKG